MTGQTPERDRTQDESRIRGLRTWRDHGRANPRKEQYIISSAELDALLDAAAERDRLKAEACADPEPTA